MAVDVVTIYKGETVTMADINAMSPAAFAQFVADMDACDCVLPEQSCPVCRKAARELYGDEYD
jgi:hypothetical protein